VRLLRPVTAVRAGVLVLGLAVCLPATPVSAQAKTGSAQSKTTQAKKPTYSAKSSKARKARLARARAAARAREQARLRQQRLLQEAMTPRYKTDASGALVPDVRAAAAIIFDPETGQVLWQENASDKRSIASITKVMTAVVFLEDNPDLSREITIQRSDVYRASTTYLRVNERVTLDNVLHLTLIASDNAAARALARVSHGGADAFLARMNEKALELGLESTAFADPSGLNANNVSSAYDLSRLITYAVHDDRIAAVMRKSQHSLRTSRRTITINNTNHLLRGGDATTMEVMGGKTGFITKAGYCLATLLRLPQTNHQVAVVVLGATSNTGRFWETRHLFNWLSDKASELFGKDQQE
jgi:D-alanyl-D-alanine endopeptidase (penicillin-binding protein 7)